MNCLYQLLYICTNNKNIHIITTMGVIFLIMVSTTIFLILLPIIFKLLFRYVLGFSRAELKLKNPFKYIRLFLHLRDPLWAIQSLTVFIQQVRVTLNRKKLKICIQIQRPRIILIRDQNQLLPLKIVDGIKENNLFYNLVTILKIAKIMRQKQKPIKKYTKNKKQDSRLVLAFKAALHFAFLLLMQLLEFKILSGDVAVVSALPKEYSDFQKSDDIRAKISMLECFAEYLFHMAQLSIGASLYDHHQLDINFNCPLLRLYTSQHMEQVLVKSQDLDIDIRIPFTFSLAKSIQKIGVFISAPKISSHSTPIDFQHLSKFLNQMMFDCSLLTKKPAEQSKQKQKQKQQELQLQIQQNPKRFILSIQQAEIKMTNINQPDYDTAQALKYLSNITYALVKFKKIKLNDDGFFVNEASLSVKKYENSFQTEQVGYCKEVVKINNLVITKQGKTTYVTHDDVVFCCQRQQLALLSKLFLLINERVIVDQYDEAMYQPYAQTVQAYMDGKSTLTQAFEQVITKKYQNMQNSLHRLKDSTKTNKQNTVIYNPKQIQLQLDISQLTHKITLLSSQYKQSRTFAGQINHQLSFKRIVMEYKNLKEFQVADFKLYYKQTQSINQLQLQVAQIHMSQNFNTLKDYFVGFTIFKLLLQFPDEDSLQLQNVKKAGKISKKCLNFGKIIINYATQLLTLRKLSVMKQTNPDGKLASLYFSLSKCDFSVQKLYQTKKILRYPLNPSHNVLSISSITIKQFLTTIGGNSALGPKIKYMINIKNPVLLLPEIDIEQRLLNYVKTFNKLEPSLQIFMNNTTEQKLRAKRRKYKVFMIDPDVFMIKVTNLVIGMEDTVFDRSMLNRMRFGREYLERKPKYNQSQFINFLRQTAVVHNLFQIQIQCISVQMKPLQSAGKTEKSVKIWCNQLRQKYRQIQIEQQNDQFRLIRVNNFGLNAQVTGMRVKIRDYPHDLINVSKIKGNLQYVKTKNIYEETFHYLLSYVTIHDVSINVGLCLLSGLGQVERKVSKYRKAMDQYKNTDQFLYTLKNKGSLQLSSFKPYWHIMHKSSDWYIKIQKQSQIQIKLLTGLTPYSTQNLNLKLGSISLISNPIITQLSIQFLQLCGSKSKIFEVGRQKIGLKSIYREPDLYFRVNFAIESHSMENKNLKDNYVRVSEQITKQLWNIKQLSRDWLLIYGLVERGSKKQQNVLKRQQQSSYAQLLKLAMDLQLKNKDRELSIFSVLKQIKLNFYVDKFCLEIADKQNQVNFIIKDFNFSINAHAAEQRWKLSHFLILTNAVAGRLKIYKRKCVTLYESNDQFLTAFLNVSEEQIMQQKQERQTFKEVFFVSRDLRIRLFLYQEIQKQIFLVQKKVQVYTLKIQLTTQLKRILDSLFSSIFKTNIQKVENFNKNKFFRMSATQKFRELVVLVIRANRKKKRLCNRLKLYVIIKYFEIGLKTPKRLLLLTNQKPTKIKYDTVHANEDLYRVDPKVAINCRFDDVEVWVSTHPNHLWVLGKGYSPKILVQSQRILKCSNIKFLLQKHQNEIIPPDYMQIIKAKKIQRYTYLFLQIFQGSIQFTRQNIEILKQIGEILINIVSSKQQRKKQMFAQKQKYQEMITNGRQEIKNKLSWKYTDIIKHQETTLLSKVSCQFQNINFVLCGTKQIESSVKSKQMIEMSQISQNRSRVMQNKTKYPLINLVSSNIQIKIKVLSQFNLQKQVRINNLTIYNCLEPQISPFYILFQMNHPDDLAAIFKIQDCLLSANNQKIFWNYFKSFYVHIFPIKVRFTEQLYSQIYFFLFGSKPELQQQKQEQQLCNIIPDYYQSVILDQFKVQAWYRTPSRLKRLQGVNVGLQRFQLNDVFLDRKRLFDRWVKFLLKQLASQFFNVIGQKIFGSSE